MLEEIRPDLFRVRVPMPNNPLKYLNVYVVRGGNDGRNLIVDTGLNQEESIQTLESALDQLDLDPRETDLFLTHFHADHTGLVGWLATGSTTVYMGEPDWKKLRPCLERAGREDPAIQHPLVPELEGARRHGFPEPELETIRGIHPASTYHPSDPLTFEDRSEGDRLNYGRYRFECLETPGHTPGHRSLYEPEHRLLVAGDHLLVDITPNIAAFLAEDKNPLKSFFQSLRKIRDYRVDRVLPGHRRTFEDANRRVDELLAHHRDRLDEIRDRIDGEPRQAYEMSSWLSWDIEYDVWEDTHPLQRWFALGETLAHLKYLHQEEELRRIRRDDSIYYVKS